MEKFKYFPCLLLAFAISLDFNTSPVNGQSSSSGICTGAMINSFGSCISYLTSGSNSSSPSPGCCNSLRSLMSNGQDCLCLIVTGGQPLQVPINRNLAMFLPRACKMSGVPIECRAIASPVPAPVAFSPPPFTPPAGSGGGGLTPPLSPEGDIIPTLTPPGMRPTLTTSTAQPPHNALPSLLVAVFVVFLLKCY